MSLIETKDAYPVNSERRKEEVRVYDVEVTDSYKDGDFDKVNEFLYDLQSMGFYGDSSVDLVRERKNTIDLNNPATRKFIDTIPGVGDWFQMVPTAAALDPIYNPVNKSMPNGAPITAEIRSFFRNGLDPIGLRSRAEVMKQIIFDEVIGRSGLEDGKWVSLACGAAQPVFESLDRVVRAGKSAPEITLVDYDKNALQLAKAYAEKFGYGNNVMLKRMNILDPKGIAQKRNGHFLTNALESSLRLPVEGYQVVDAVGILEYLKEDNLKYSYSKVMKTEREMAGAVRFLENAYDLVAPGGLLVVGNMRDTHPQLGFTLNTVQWPHIQPRSLSDMISIFKNAGLDGEVEIYCPTDGVYAIYTVRKPIHNN